VVLGTACEITILHAETTDNGDGDFYPDTNETVDMRILLINNCGADLHNCTAFLSGGGPNVDCILNPVISLGDLADSANTVLSSEAFVWKVANINRANINDLLQASFNVSISCDEIDTLSVPQTVAVDVDLDLNDLMQAPDTWNEGFESATLGKFVAENLDNGIPGANNSEGLQNGDDWRCQYSDPDWPNSGPYGDDAALNCYPGASLASANAVFWQVDGQGVAGSPDGGRAYDGTKSMYYGVFQTNPAGSFSTPTADVESVRTSAGINLGANSPELAFWQQISLVDGRAIVMPLGRSADRGVVQIRTFDAVSDVATSPWMRLEPFQNTYDEVAAANFFNCMFDPVDDGNTEDDFFDPSDPNRRTGPSSTCYPMTSWAYMGDTDAPFAVTNVGDATTPPESTDVPDFGTGTWIKSKVDLYNFRGKRVRLRFLATALKLDFETYQEQFSLQAADPRDDGWWLDSVNVDEVFSTAGQFTVDSKTTKSCCNDANCQAPGPDFPNVGCQTNQDCIDQAAGSSCLGPAPPCGATCTSNLIDVNVETEPDANVQPFSEVLNAPGEPIEINAVTSTGVCLSGSLQYRYSNNATLAVLRDWSENPIFVDAPLSDTEYKVEVRCSRALTCLNSAVVTVTVTCPYSTPRLRPNLFTHNPVAPVDPGGVIGGSCGGAGCGLVLASSGTAKNTFQWTTSTRREVFRGPISGVSTYTGSIVAFGPAQPNTSFVDAAVPSSGQGFYYLVREAGDFLHQDVEADFCNERGYWSGGGVSEAPTGATLLRDPSLGGPALLPP
jgi:hypothetical protein